MQPERDLLIPQRALNGGSGETMRLTRESAGFDYLSFRARRLVKGESFSDETGDNEMGLVVLGGRC